MSVFGDRRGLHRGTRRRLMRGSYRPRGLRKFKRRGGWTMKSYRR